MTIFWDVIIGFFITISTILTPINLAFPKYRLNYYSYSTFIYCIDIVFVIDILINFFSVYEDKNWVCHYSLKEISNNYLETWFPIDLLSVMPFDLIFIYGIP